MVCVIGGRIAPTAAALVMAELRMPAAVPVGLVPGGVAGVVALVGAGGLVGTCEESKKGFSEERLGGGELLTGSAAVVVELGLLGGFVEVGVDIFASDLGE